MRVGDARAVGIHGTIVRLNIGGQLPEAVIFKAYLVLDAALSHSGSIMAGDGFRQGDWGGLERKGREKLANKKQKRPN